MKIPKQILILLLITILQACTSTSYVYVKPNLEKSVINISRVVIMVEYLNLYKDLHGYQNFDENINMLKQEELLESTREELLAKGYSISAKQLLTSGLIMDREFRVDHFVDGVEQGSPILAPYIIRSIDLLDDEIVAYESLLAELNAPISLNMSELRSYIINNFIKQTEQLKLPNDTAVLVIQSFHPRASLFSSIDIGFSTGTFGHDDFIRYNNNRPRPVTWGYFLHVGSGDVLWSNRINLINHKNQQKFFNGIPNMSYN